MIRGGGEGEKSKSRPSSGSNLPGCHNSGHLIYMFFVIILTPQPLPGVVPGAGRLQPPPDGGQLLHEHPLLLRLQRSVPRRGQEGLPGGLWREEGGAGGRGRVGRRRRAQEVRRRRDGVWAEEERRRRRGGDKGGSEGERNAGR